MFNYLLKIEYDGTNFVGWQSQKNGKSIQDNIEKALRRVLGIKIRINGSGRTDKGVHAFSQFANFKVTKKIINKKVFLESINYFLRKNLISILEIKKKNNDFHARHSVRLKVYEFLIINRVGSLSIYKKRAWHVKKKIDLKLLKKGAKLLEGIHDFSTFRAASCSANSPIKKIILIKVNRSSNLIKIKFYAKSFLQSQVRSMVGSLIYLSTNKWSLKNFKEAFASKDRAQCAPPAPACGLYLKEVIY